MIKTYIYAGIVLLIIAGVLFYSLWSNITTGTPTGISNITVLSNSIAGTPIQINSTAISIIFVFASDNTNIYFLNRSVFNGLSAYLNGNTSRSALSYVQSQHVNSTDIFQNNNSAIKENYQSSNSVSGSYYVYAVLDSTPGSPSSNTIVNATVVYKSYSYGSWSVGRVESLVWIAALILGLALLIYGAVKKPKDAAEAAAPIAKPQIAKRRKR